MKPLRACSCGCGLFSRNDGAILSEKRHMTKFFFEKRKEPYVASVAMRETARILDDHYEVLKTLWSKPRPRRYLPTGEFCSFGNEFHYDRRNDERVCCGLASKHSTRNIKEPL